MDYEALWLPLFLPLPSPLRLHPLSIAYAEILFVTSGREMACLTCIWERMGVQCALPHAQGGDGMEGARMPRMVQPENPPPSSFSHPNSFYAFSFLDLLRFKAEGRPPSSTDTNCPN